MFSYFCYPLFCIASWMNFGDQKKKQTNKKKEMMIVLCLDSWYIVVQTCCLYLLWFWLLVCFVLHRSVYVILWRWWMLSNSSFLSQRKIVSVLWPFRMRMISFHSATMSTRGKDPKFCSRSSVRDLNCVYFKFDWELSTKKRQKMSGSFALIWTQLQRKNTFRKWFTYICMWLSKKTSNVVVHFHLCNVFFRLIIPDLEFKMAI